mmetsp:Transcript_102579/g.319651  ORF Transcript_102579/g.319651 Transcript_102579/m.319651 type:complete len:532 (+) Transcript_102579:12-1607(+)
MLGRGRPWPRANLSQARDRRSPRAAAVGFVGLLLLSQLRSTVAERLPSAGEEEVGLQAKASTASKLTNRTELVNDRKEYQIHTNTTTHQGPCADGHSPCAAARAARRRPAAGAVALTAKGSLLGMPTAASAAAAVGSALRIGSAGDGRVAAEEAFLSMLLSNISDAAKNDTALAGREAGLPANGTLRPLDDDQRLAAQTAADHELHRLDLHPLEGVTSATPLVRIIFAIAGGTGASISSQASILFKADLVRRMRLQDTAVMLLMIGVYFITLLVTANVAYHQAANNSRITYYADPRYHTMVVEGHDMEAFLEAFAQPPKSVLLNVAGLARAVEDMPGTLRYRGGSYRVDFTFALDLSPWVVREDSPAAVLGHGGAGPELALEDGIVRDDLQKLCHALALDGNDLATIQMVKEISWPRWEELATNIKHQIRQCDYEGVLGIDRTKTEIINIYKNRQWANFMHSRTLKVVLALSILGWAFYVPYMWFRSATVRVRCLYQGFEPFDDTAFGHRPPMLGAGRADEDLSQEEDSDL